MFSHAVNEAEPPVGIPLASNGRAVTGTLYRRLGRSDVFGLEIQCMARYPIHPPFYRARPPRQRFFSGSCRLDTLVPGPYQPGNAPPCPPPGRSTDPPLPVVFAASVPTAPVVERIQPGCPPRCGNRVLWRGVLCSLAGCDSPGLQQPLPAVAAVRAAEPSQATIRAVGQQLAGQDDRCA